MTRPLLKMTEKPAAESSLYQHMFQAHMYLMEKDFDYKPHPKHQLLDHEKLEKTTETHFLLVPL